MALHSIQSSVLTVESTHTAPIVKQHTVTPLIAPDVNPCPVPLVQSRGGLTAHGAPGQ
ncbi:unnamed protein product [Staurois parvus]|uniref:Uncharacterized protein n=1 Tax=Staurois parvus TaxID=386267 RepID=A0ABN9GB55_9NEOB|nr:unnamed protein product [Staurois parvus]